MKLLEKKNYYKLTEPLKQVTINNLFARAVIEHRVSGKVYVDDCDNPRTYYVVHPYGMSLLFGDWNNEKFNNSFRDYSLNSNRIREKYEWMQAFPNDWDMVLQELFKDCLIKSSDNIKNRENGIIELNTRINFKFNPARYPEFKKKHIPADIEIVRTDKQIFRDMKGSVIPAYFWDSADDFADKGVGFSLFHENKLASTAYSAFIDDYKLELGIETVEEFRGSGFAQFACSALIDYCIEKNLEPIWACRLENDSSYKLAQKLGFEPVLEIPYYRLSK
jgi:GNAT superfamily N-acetyltransferase